MRAADPHPTGGEGEAPPALRIRIGPTLKNFSALKIEKFSYALN